MFVIYTTASAIAAEQTGAHLLNFWRGFFWKRNLSCGDKRSPFIYIGTIWFPSLEQRLTMAHASKGSRQKEKFGRSLTDIPWNSLFFCMCMHKLPCDWGYVLPELQSFLLCWKPSIFTHFEESLKHMPLCSSPWQASLSDTYNSWWSNFPLSSDFACVLLKFFSVRTYSLNCKLLHSWKLALCHHIIFSNHYFCSSRPHLHHFEFKLSFLPLFLWEKTHTQEIWNDVPRQASVPLLSVYDLNDCLL